MLYSIFVLCYFAGHFKNWNTPGAQERVEQETNRNEKQRIRTCLFARDERGRRLYLIHVEPGGCLYYYQTDFKE